MSSTAFWAMISLYAVGLTVQFVHAEFSHRKRIKALRLEHAEKLRKHFDQGFQAGFEEGRLQHDSDVGQLIIELEKARRELASKIG